MAVIILCPYLCYIYTTYLILLLDGVTLLSWTSKKSFCSESLLVLLISMQDICLDFLTLDDSSKVSSVSSDLLPECGTPWNGMVLSVPTCVTLDGSSLSCCGIYVEVGVEI